MFDDGLIGFLKSGSHRIEILKMVNKQEPITPKEISEELNIHFSQVSRTLFELEKEELIECTTPKRKKGRIYRTTQKGKNVLQKTGDVRQ